jgi:hypothetical protein
VNVQYMRDYAREMLDLEEDDVSDRLIDRWINQGVMRVQRFVQKWPFYEDALVLPVEGGQADYGTSFKELRSIFVEGVGALDYIDQTTAARYYHRPSGVRTGEPKHFSLWGTGNVRLWPIPDKGYVARIEGYRRPLPIIAPDADAEAGAEPDLPADFHEVVLEWVMHRAYLHQDDPELGDYHKAAFEELLRQLAADEMALDPVEPIVLNGGPRQRSQPPWGEPVGPGLGGWGGA